MRPWKLIEPTRWAIVPGNGLIAVSALLVLSMGAVGINVPVGLRPWPPGEAGDRRGERTCGCGAWVLATARRITLR